MKFRDILEGLRGRPLDYWFLLGLGVNDRLYRTTHDRRNGVSRKSPKSDFVRVFGEVQLSKDRSRRSEGACLPQAGRSAQ